MPSMPWVKLWIEMIDDVKLAELDDAQKWRFVQLILLAGECDAAGAFVTGDSRMTHAQIAWRLRCDKFRLDEDILKMIEAGLLIEEDCLIVAKFRDRQGPTQSEKRQKWAERQQKRREKVNVTHDSRVTHADVTPLEEEEEEDKEEDVKRTTAAIFQIYESEISPLTPMVSDKVGSWIDDYPEDWIKDAIKEAVNNNVRKPAYIDKILRTWQAEGRKNGKKAYNPEDYATEVFQ